MDGTPPKSNGSNGGDPNRGPDGKFRPGNRAAAGRRHPHAARVAKLRAALLESVTDADIRDIVARIVAEAKAGNLKAAAWIIDRVAGKIPELLDALTRIRAGQYWLECPLPREAREQLVGVERDAEPPPAADPRATLARNMQALAAGLRGGAGSKPPADAG